MVLKLFLLLLFNLEGVFQTVSDSIHGKITSFHSIISLCILILKLMRPEVELMTKS